MKRSTSTAPLPPFAVSESGRIRYTRSRKSPELGFEPSPLSGIAQNSPCPASRMAENPGIGWPGNGGVTPLSPAMKAPDGGPGWYSFAGRIARPRSVGSLRSAARASAVNGAPASPAASTAKRTLSIGPPFPAPSPGLRSLCAHVHGMRNDPLEAARAHRERTESGRSDAAGTGRRNSRTAASELTPCCRRIRSWFHGAVGPGMVHRNELAPNGGLMARAVGSLVVRKRERRFGHSARRLGRTATDTASRSPARTFAGTSGSRRHLRHGRPELVPRESERTPLESAATRPCAAPLTRPRCLGQLMSSLPTIGHLGGAVGR